MESSLVPIDPALLALIHGQFGRDGGLVPFSREITLVECSIAGTSYRPVKAIEPMLLPGALLVLQREPNNPHDELAIKVLAESGDHIGYIPRAKNEALARLMDAGKLIFARFVAKQWQGDWLEIEVQVVLRDI